MSGYRGRWGPIPCKALFLDAQLLLSYKIHSTWPVRNWHSWRTPAKSLGVLEALSTLLASCMTAELVLYLMLQN